MTGGCARPIRGARVNRLRSNATKWPIRGRELIKVHDLFKEIWYHILADFEISLKFLDYDIIASLLVSSNVRRF